MKRKFGALLLACISLYLVPAMALPLSLGQGVSQTGDNFEICVGGERRLFAERDTVDRWLRNGDEDGLGGCPPAICPPRVEGLTRPYQVRRSFSLVHKAGREHLVKPFLSSDRIKNLFKNDPLEFSKICGTGYAAEIDRGGSLLANVTVSFTSEEERNIFLEETRFDIGNMRALPKLLQGRRDVDGTLGIMLTQTGGDPGAFARLTGNGATLLCRLSEPEGCMNTLDALWFYGISEWAETLDFYLPKAADGWLMDLKFISGQYGAIVQ